MGKRYLSCHSRASTELCRFVTDKPRIDRDHGGRVHVWAGKTHNISCNVEAYPSPEIEWWREGRKLGNNLTYTVYIDDTYSNLQVRYTHQQF